MRLEREQHEWEELAKLDPYWAVLPTAEGPGSWDADAFLAGGVGNVQHFWSRATQLLDPMPHSAALDFGCGVGRQTRALADRFQEVVGVDIAEPMILEARRLNADVANCHFQINVEDTLRQFPNDRFDLVYSLEALQHVSSAGRIFGYVDEFLRVLRPGGLLAFHLPTSTPLRNQIQPRRRLFWLLRRIGLSTERVYGLVRGYPMPTTVVPVDAMRSFLTSRGARVLAIDEANRGSTKAAMYYAAKP